MSQQDKPCVSKIGVRESHPYGLSSNGMVPTPLSKHPMAWHTD
jgi:hypothetical protein